MQLICNFLCPFAFDKNHFVGRKEANIIQINLFSYLLCQCRVKFYLMKNIKTSLIVLMEKKTMVMVKYYIITN